MNSTVGSTDFPSLPSSGRWQFWIDRGGTFTDIVAQRPDGTLVVHKLLSENPGRYTDAPLQGIRDLIGIAADAPIPSDQITCIKMGTTVATNALLERKGDRTLLLITQGFRDALRIGYQNRPQIFARHIVLPSLLYEQVIEVEERYSAQGEELIPLTINEALVQALQTAYDHGIRACAIALLHGYRYPHHEQQLATLAQTIGFTQVSTSHSISPLMKLISRADTTVVDAYLSPILQRYISRMTDEICCEMDGERQPHNLEEHELGAMGSPQEQSPQPQLKLLFMQSNGGLTDAQFFQGKDSILSGPAGGIVGAVKTSAIAGFRKIIGFDMGGTSTDVSHYSGEYERSFETEVAGVRLRAPMLSIHTVAAGGGSILKFDGSRYRVGPESAGAYPGPACYRRGGPLTVTDCNVMLGKLQPDYFPKVFGNDGSLPFDRAIVQQQFAELAGAIQAQTLDQRTPEQVASGFLAIAIDTMANAIKKISIQRGYDITTYTLCCFGGAGGQHACLIAEALGINQIFIHPYAGVLSAYGIGLADLRSLQEQAIEARLDLSLMPQLAQVLDPLTTEGKAELHAQGVAMDQIEIIQKVYLRYEGTDTALMVDFADLEEMRSQFNQVYQQRYGFTMTGKALVVEAVSAEAFGQTYCPKTDCPPEVNLTGDRTDRSQPLTTVPIYTKGKWYEASLYRREDLQPGDRITGAALIIEPTGTNVVEPGWMAELTVQNHLVLNRDGRMEQVIDERVDERVDALKDLHRPDPVLLEIFNNLVQAIAEQMGITLQNTSYSVNIKERLDFSCAIFDAQGSLIANAPHIPVHLGSMSESIRSLMVAKGDSLKLGDVYVSNNPYNGGTHLPDITVITPVFHQQERNQPIFYVASRGHHADIGGITPGSMPPHSTSIDQEGILIDNVQLVDRGQFREAAVMELLTTGNYPVRNLQQNIADLQAQIAANERGMQELDRMVADYGLNTVQAYMQHIQDNAEASVRQVISGLQDGQFCYEMDDGICIRVSLTIDPIQRSACIDFTGTSPQQSTNLNAPLAICKAVVLYVFRTLVDDNIPLNAGCLKPLEIIVPEGCLLNPKYPAAVVAGNVETSQAIANALYGALGILAAGQGTMNNFTFGNDTYQYYETICGGSGAGASFEGTDAVQTHMTNSRLTDPEVLEWRFPVLVEAFEIRQNSGGKGQYCGGNGVVRRIRFRESMTAAILSGHRVIPPFGLAGGEVGAIGRNWIERSNGQVEHLMGKAEVQMQVDDVFVIETPGGGGFGCPDVLQLPIHAIQLNRLNWRDYINSDNPVAAALMSKMKIAKRDRPKVKAECLRLLVTLKLDPAKTRLISKFIDTYLRLNTQEEQTFQAELDKIGVAQKEAIMQVITSWEEKGIETGIETGQRSLVSLQLEQKVGQLPDALTDRISALPLDRLSVLAIALLNFNSIDDLNQWLETNSA
jgi:5-oxoprolinase (ATP-hydrolysing)